MGRSLLCAAMLAFGLLAASCAWEDAGRARDRPEDEATSARASEYRRVLGVQGISPGRRRAALVGGPTRSSGVSAEDGALGGTGEGDLLVAGRGAQTVRGLGGGDALSGGGGRDRLLGGPGDDLINAQGDNARDLIDCGPGQDEVLMRGEDGEDPRRCETLGVGWQ